MVRSVLSILSVACFVVLLLEALGVAVLWSRDRLTAASVNEIRLILTGQVQDDVDVEVEKESFQPSIEEVVNQRTMRILDLQRREEELAQLKTLITASRVSVLEEQDAFAKKRDKFQEELAQQNERLASEAVEQAREILLNSQPADVVKNLMGLTLEEDIVLVKGMPEKKIALFLQEFGNGQVEQIERGRKIFEAISRGEPSQKVVTDALKTLNQQPGVPNTES